MIAAAMAMGNGETMEIAWVMIFASINPLKKAIVDLIFAVQNREPASTVSGEATVIAKIGRASCRERV